MNEVINRMYEKKRNPYPETIAAKFVTYKNHYDTIIIVEGATDENFYKNTDIEILNNACYIYANQSADILGKKAVIEAYFKIREYSRNSIFKNSVIFIVDKDFFGINWRADAYKNFAKTATEEDTSNFTVLDCHSHECYFILEDNLKQIFKLLNIEDKLEKFNEILQENLEDLAEYFAYKSILEDENPGRSRDCKNIKGIEFGFQYDGSELTFDKDAIEEAIDKMKLEVKYSENMRALVSQYRDMKEKLQKNPELLRGHTMFELLECYLKHYGKTLKNDRRYNAEIINNMEIPIDIKVLKFGIGKYKQEEKIIEK